MIYKISHSDFEINLRTKDIETTEQNPWFQDGPNLFFSIPFTVNLTKEIDQAFGMLSHPNADNIIKSLDVKLFKFNRFYDAVLFVERVENEKVTFSLQYGSNDYPNFQKDLRLLPLDDFEISESIEDYAQSINQLSYPDVTHNFPAVIIPENYLENNTGRWDFFEGIMNKKENGNFVQNVFDSQENVALNRNLMQPFPYILHVLKKGFEDAGFELKGDILEDELLQHMMMGSLAEFYASFAQDQEEFVVTSEDLDQSVFLKGRFILGTTTKEIQITEPGIYKIAGNTFLRRATLLRCFFVLKQGNTILLNRNRRPAGRGRTDVYERLDIDVVVTEPTTFSVDVQGGLKYNEMDELLNETFIDLTFTKLASFDQNGNPISTIASPNRIKLNEIMPDKTFGDLVKAVMAFRNYDINPVQNEIWMNKVTDQLLQPVSQDISFLEAKTPEIEFQENISFLLQFQPANDDDRFRKVFFDRNGARTTEFSRTESTQDINIDLLPLFSETKDEITTVNFDRDYRSTIAVFMYNATLFSNNETQPNTPLLLPDAFQEVYEDWLGFRISSSVFKFRNLITVEEALSLSVFQKSYAYNRSHIIREIIVKLIDKDMAYIEIETES